MTATTWTPYDGPIRIGDQFEWCPYGHRGWPRSYAHVEVTKIGDDGAIWSCRINSEGEPINDQDEDIWNDETTFRDHVRLLYRPTDGID